MRENAVGTRFMMVEMRKVDEPEKKQGQEDEEDKNASFVSGFEHW